MMQPQGSFDLPPQLSTIAPDVDWLYDFIYYVSVVSFILIVGAMVVFSVKYRRRPGVQAKPTGHSTVLEVAWTFSPLILLVFLFHAGFKIYMDGAVAPRDALEIRVTGKQWSWDFMHGNGGVETNEVTLPVGTPVKLVMSSVDVLHSFFVPDFRVKRDVVPGMYTSLWFEAIPEAEGRDLTVYCAEYCGAPEGIENSDEDNTNHSTMRARMHMVSREAYEAYIPGLVGPPSECADAPEPLVCWGERLYSGRGCAACHSVDGTTASVGPNWGGIFGAERAIEGGGNVLVDENYVRESILNPSAKIAQGFTSAAMPPFSLDDAEIDALIAYMRSLNE